MNGCGRQLIRTQVNYQTSWRWGEEVGKNSNLTGGLNNLVETSLSIKFSHMMCLADLMTFVRESTPLVKPVHKAVPGPSALSKARQTWIFRPNLIPWFEDLGTLGRSWYNLTGQQTN